MVRRPFHPIVLAVRSSDPPAGDILRAVYRPRNPRSARDQADKAVIVRLFNLTYTRDIRSKKFDVQANIHQFDELSFSLVF